ncbi:MAG: hypothetical protein QME32_08495, partial [Endomicrobiia bacterium]|nr:hypothetical protein [Endomicrobiia bacterium]
MDDKKPKIPPLPPKPTTKPSLPSKSAAGSPSPNVPPKMPGAVRGGLPVRPGVPAVGAPFSDAAVSEM